MPLDFTTFTFMTLTKICSSVSVIHSRLRAKLTAGEKSRNKKARTRRASVGARWREIAIGQLILVRRQESNPDSKAHAYRDQSQLSP